MYRKAKLLNKLIKKDDVSEWLKNQDVHQQTTINKVEKLNFKPIYTDGMYDFQIDLTFFPRYKKQNDGNYIVFTAININTRFGYVYYWKKSYYERIFTCGHVYVELLPINIKYHLVSEVLVDF